MIRLQLTFLSQETAETADPLKIRIGCKYDQWITKKDLSKYIIRDLVVRAITNTNTTDIEISEFTRMSITSWVMSSQVPNQTEIYGLEDKINWFNDTEWVDYLEFCKAKAHLIFDKIKSHRGARGKLHTEEDTELVDLWIQTLQTIFHERRSYYTEMRRIEPVHLSDDENNQILYNQESKHDYEMIKVRREDAITSTLDSLLIFDTGTFKSCENCIDRLSNVITLRKPIKIIGVGGTDLVSHTGSWMPGFDNVCFTPDLPVALFSPNEFMVKFGGKFTINAEHAVYENTRLNPKESIFAHASENGQLIVDYNEMKKIVAMFSSQQSLLLQFYCEQMENKVRTLLVGKNDVIFNISSSQNSLSRMNITQLKTKAIEMNKKKKKSVTGYSVFRKGDEEKLRKKIREAQ